VLAFLDQLIVNLTEVHLEAVIHDWRQNLVLVASLGHLRGVQGDLSEGSKFADHGRLFEQISKLGLFGLADWVGKVLSLFRYLGGSLTARIYIQITCCLCHAVSRLGRGSSLARLGFEGIYLRLESCILDIHQMIILSKLFEIFKELDLSRRVFLEEF